MSRRMSSRKNWSRSRSRRRRSLSSRAAVRPVVDEWIINDSLLGSCNSTNVKDFNSHT